MPSRLDTIREIRLEKLKKVLQKKINPYPPVFHRSNTIEEARGKEKSDVTIAGRLTGWREHGKVIFADLSDESGKIQIMLREDDLGNTVFADLMLYDLGDFLGVRGQVEQTKTGEITVRAKELTLLSKALRPLPSTWEGLKDADERFRKRYLDTLMNPQAKKILDTRWIAEKELRR